MRLVGAYLYAHVSTDARDDEAATLQSRFQADTAGLATLTKRLQAWVARVGADGLVARSTGRRRPRVPAATGGGGGRAPDERGRGGPGLRAGPHRRPGLGEAARRHHRSAHRAGRPGRPDDERRGRAAADEHRARPGHRPRRRRASGGVRGRAGGVGDRGGAAGRRPQRVQGRGQHAQPPPGLGRLARPGAVQQQRRPRHARGDAGGGRGRRSPTSPATPGQGRAARPRRRAAVVGPARAGRRAAAASLARGHRLRWPTRSPATRPAWPTWCARADDGGLARRRAARRQGRRRVLHAGAGRRQPRAAQLRRQLRQRADAGPRARPRLPQRQPGPPHAAAAPDADGAGRDGEHLLRDDHGAGRPGRRRRRPGGPAGHPRRRPAGRRPRSWPTSTRGSCSSGP